MSEEEQLGMKETPATPSSLIMSPAQIESVQDDGDRVGPHPSHITVARLYITQWKIDQCLRASGVSEAKEEAMRLQGVSWIDNTRKALNLPVRTYNTACRYYHKFRLAQHDGEYGYIEAIAAAALFTACKIEDTQKRSRDILCSAHNLKVASASEHLTPDDPRFESQAKSVVALERLMLESSAFDFRSTFPQKIVVKLGRSHGCKKETVGRVSWNMCNDLYRTYAPLKQTSQTLAFACVELAGRLLGENVTAIEEGRGYSLWRTSREEVMETMQDLLELYIQHGSKGSSTVAMEHTVEEFIATRIPLNQEAQKEGLPRYTGPQPSSGSGSGGATSSNGQATGKGASNGRSGGGAGPGHGRAPSNKATPTSPAESLLNKTPGTGESPSTPRRSEREARAQGTVRFMLDGESAAEEKAIVDRFFKIEEEEVEVEEEIEESKLRSQEREREQREQREQREREREQQREQQQQHSHNHPPHHPREGRGGHGGHGGHHYHRGRDRGRGGWGRDRDHGHRSFRGRGGGGGGGGGGDRGDRGDRGGGGGGGDDRGDHRDRDNDRFRDSHHDRSERDRDRRRF